MQNKGLLIGIGIFIAVVLFGGYFVLAGNRTKSSPTSTPTPIAETTVDSGQTADANEVKEVTVEAKEFSFSPSTLTLTKGEKVRILFKNAGRMSHDFVIEELNIKTKTVAPGGEDMLEFTPPESGALTFYCSLGNHRALGVEGQIEVE